MNPIVEKLEALEAKVRKLVLEHNSLKKELYISIEENKELKQTIQTLLGEIEHFKTLAQEGSKNEELESVAASLREENSELLATLEKIQQEIDNIQTNSDTFVEEYDTLKEQYEFESSKTSESQDLIEKLESEITEYKIHRDKLFLETESLKIQFEAVKEKNSLLKETVQKQEEQLKNFHNQENLSKIVTSIAEDTTQTNELKLRINEYIKEIDKCIAHLSE